MKKTQWFESYSKFGIQEMVDEWCSNHEMISVSITETEGPQHYLAVVLYRDPSDQAMEARV